ncbi:glucose-6-phosphate dehydrogenase [Candidatus Wolfebacteria bacterium]|nr:glucose-6-phosphate dehydrogenase [Candidatus Wolfebacteria bacterium]
MPSNSKTNIPTILVILGATGDLVAKKISPALFHLYSRQELPDRFRIVGFSRRDLTTADFQKKIAGITGKHSDKTTKKFLLSFLKLFSYTQGQFQNKSDYYELKKVLEGIDAGWGLCSNKLFYLAVPPALYSKILKNLKSSGLTKPCSPEQGWTRVIVEKPFGKDAKTGRALDKLLTKLFKEIQIYRVDHYLAKEMLQNMLVFRFANNLFENNWSNNLIEKIDIRLHEKIGVEDRGAFYDGVGALRDVGQNHLLQMIALTLMDYPENFRPDSIRKNRATILQNLKILTPTEIKNFTFRGQYNGYQKIKGVKLNSKTETYFKARAFLLHPRWENIPITLESGKRLGESKKEIVITFVHPLPCLCPTGGPHYKNRIIFHLEPKEGITIQFWSKKPGSKVELEERTFDFLFRQNEKRVQYTEEYEKLLLDCILGDQTLFVSSEEVEAMWRFIDPIYHAWEKGAIPLLSYKPDTQEILRETDRLEEERQGVQEKNFRKEIGIIGLGKMGLNIGKRLLQAGSRVVGFDENKNAVKELEKLGGIGTGSIRELTTKLSRPKIIWLMLPAGDAVEKVIFGSLANLLQKGDVIIDGGNSFYEDSMRRQAQLKKLEIEFLDAGVSGGPEGVLKGPAIMVGGGRNVFDKIEPLFRDLAGRTSYGYMGVSGAGHFVKMIHNGIEYGMMQAIAEGFALMKKSPYKLDLRKIAGIYNHGSVIESKLIGWLGQAFHDFGQELKPVSGRVAHTGEGEWTVKTARKMKIPVPIIKGSFEARKKSKKNPSYGGKILTALRHQFGGHSIK